MPEKDPKLNEHFNICIFFLASATLENEWINTNLKTTVENHYWEYVDNSGENAKDAPTKYNTETNTYDDANKLGWVLSFKYGHCLYK